MSCLEVAFSFDFSNPLYMCSHLYGLLFISFCFSWKPEVLEHLVVGFFFFGGELRAIFLIFHMVKRILEVFNWCTDLPILARKANQKGMGRELEWGGFVQEPIFTTEGKVQLPCLVRQTSGVFASSTVRSFERLLEISEDQHLWTKVWHLSFGFSSKRRVERSKIQYHSF